MSTGDSAVQIRPADQAFDVRTFEPTKPGLKRKETMAQHDARLYGNDKVSQHIKKYDTNGDGNFSVAEVKIIIEEMERDENQVKSLKKVVAGVVFLCIIFIGVLLGIILGANEMSKETHAKGGVMEDLDGNAIKVATVASVGTLLDLPNYDAETMKTLKSLTFEPIILEATIELGDEMHDDNTTTTIETTFYEQRHNVSVYMNVIGFQKSANSITLHGGFNGQSLFVNGDYASYTVGGKVYDVKVEAEADSRRRLDDHHARQGGQRRFLFEDTEAMHKYHDEMHRIVDVTPTDIDYQHGRSLVAKDVGFHRRRLATVGSSDFQTRTGSTGRFSQTIDDATWAPFPKFFVELGRTKGRTWPIQEPTSRCVNAGDAALPEGTFTPYQNLEFGVRCCAGRTQTDPQWKSVPGEKSNLNWAQAQQACAEEGYTLCTRNQIAKAEEGNGRLGDGNDNRMVWSSTPCGGTDAMKKYLARFGWNQKVKVMTNTGFSTDDVDDPTAATPADATWAPNDYFLAYIGRTADRTHALTDTQKQQCLKADSTEASNAPFGKETGTFCCEAKPANTRNAGVTRVASPKGQTWAQGQQQCANVARNSDGFGYTLCTKDQVKYAAENNIGAYAGDGLDNLMIWTNTPCYMTIAEQMYMTRFGWGQAGDLTRL